jgi:hypothetical protein
VAARETGLPRERLDALLDPAQLTRGGIKGGSSGGLRLRAVAASAQAAQSALPADWCARLRRALLPAPDHRLDHSHLGRTHGTFNR